MTDRPFLFPILFSISALLLTFGGKEEKLFLVLSLSTFQQPFVLSSQRQKAWREKKTCHGFIMHALNV